MADLELRRIELHEIEAFAACQASAFGGRYTADRLESLAEELQLDRSLAVFDRGDLVGTAGSYVVSMTLPGLVRCEVAAVTDVSVAPTHRRRGLLTSMMRRQLDDIHSRAEALAVLLASEGGIYGRYGYGPATLAARYVVDKRRARLLTSLAPATASSWNSGSGSVRLVERAQATEAFPLVYGAYVPTRVGELDRLQGDWTELLGDLSGAGEDAKHRFYVCYEQGGRIDGYAVYRVAAMDPADHWRRAVFLEELCSVTDVAYTSLWRYLLGIDLTEELRTRGRPVDEPLRYLLEDQRQLRTANLGDRTWVRLVDVPRALALRRYEEEQALVIEVEDPFCPWNAGRFRLCADGAGVATVESVDAPADLSLPVEALGALYLGGVPFVGMAEVGRITELTEGAARRADRMFGVRRPPFCTTSF
ncbi:MAG: GNAT family N-acetyltransferase [Acidimicrobiales bacterium]